MTYGKKIQKRGNACIFRADSCCCTAETNTVTAMWETHSLAQWHPTPVLLPGKSHGWRSLVGCSPWGHKESDTTERLHFHFSLSYIEEGNGNPLQCSCLENLRDGRAWWLLSMGLHRVEHDWSDLAAAAQTQTNGLGDTRCSGKRGFNDGLARLGDWWAGSPRVATWIKLSASYP